MRCLLIPLLSSFVACGSASEPSASAAWATDTCMHGEEREVRVAPDLGPAWERATRDAFAAWTPAPWPYHVVVSADARDDRQRCVVSVIGASLSSPTHVTWGLTDYGVIHVETRLETDDALKRAILTHEVGHAFGLGHVQDDKRAVMWPFITIGGVPTCRDRHDLDRLWGIGPESCDR